MSNSILALLRKQQKAPEPPEPPPSFSSDVLRSAVSKDQGLSTPQRNEVLEALNDPNFLSSLKTGAISALLGGLLGKFMKLSGETRLLLSLAGFGIGKILYDFKQDQQGKNSSWYNPKMKMYELK